MICTYFNFVNNLHFASDDSNDICSDSYINGIHAQTSNTDTNEHFNKSYLSSENIIRNIEHNAEYNNVNVNSFYITIIFLVSVKIMYKIIIMIMYRPLLSFILNLFVIVKYLNAVLILIM